MKTPAAPVIARINKKRKEPEDYTSSTLGQPGPSIKRGKGSKSNDAAATAAGSEPRRSKNTAVFVSNLPPDTTHDELVARFSKCGLLEEDDAGEPKVKLYARDDADGAFSGEALVVYFKEDSVTLALNILDDAELRLGEPSTRMRVLRAEFGHKGGDGKPGGGAAAGGSGAPRKTVDKRKATRRLGKMQRCVSLPSSFLLDSLARLHLSPFRPPRRARVHTRRIHTENSKSGTTRTPLGRRSRKKSAMRPRTPRAASSS